MKQLHEDKDAFATIIKRIQERSGCRLDVIEKDYYIVCFLKELKEKQKTGVHAYFKGGTALYKKLKNMKRFSEDIDISIDARWLSRTQCDKQLSLATKEYSILPRNKDEGYTQRSAVETVYDYTPLFDYDSGDALQRFGKVKVEATSFAISEPTDKLEITSLIYDFANDEEKRILKEVYGFGPFTMEIISMERLFIDKLFAAEAYTERADQQSKAFEAAKHIYDLAVMSDMTDIQALLKDNEQIQYLLKVRMEEEVGRLDGVAGKLPRNFCFFKDAFPDKRIKKAYEEMTKNYVFKEADIILFSDAQEKINNIHNELKTLSAWEDIGADNELAKARQEFDKNKKLLSYTKSVEYIKEKITGNRNSISVEEVKNRQKVLSDKYGFYYKDDAGKRSRRSGRDDR